VIVGKPDVLQPSILGIGVGVAHDVVGSHNLIVASPLRNYRKEVAERSGKRKVGVGRSSSAIERSPGDRGMGAATARRAIAMAKTKLTKVIIVSDLEGS